MSGSGGAIPSGSLRYVSVKEDGVGRRTVCIYVKRLEDRADGSAEHAIVVPAIGPEREGDFNAPAAEADADGRRRTFACRIVTITRPQSLGKAARGDASTYASWAPESDLVEEPAWRPRLDHLDQQVCAGTTSRAEVFELSPGDHRGADAGSEASSAPSSGHSRRRRPRRTREAAMPPGLTALLGELIKSNQATQVQLAELVQTRAQAEPAAPRTDGTRDLFDATPGEEVDVEVLRRSLGPPPVIGARPTGLFAVPRQARVEADRTIVDRREETQDVDERIARAVAAAMRQSGRTPQNESKAIAPGARGLAALDEAKAAFAEQPIKKYEYVRSVVRKALRNTGESNTALEVYFDKFVRFTDPTTPYFLTILAEIIDAIEKRDSSRALGVAAGGVQFLEQRAIDGDDNLDVAWLCTLLEEPLIKPKEPVVAAKGQGRAGRAGAAARRNYGQTIERPTLTSVCAAIRDWEALDRLRRGLSVQE